MKINRCIHCMEDMGEGAAVCPCCGKGQERPAGYDGLRPSSILHGRYLTGLLLEERGDTYIAFDLARGERVSVKEFCPCPLARRDGAAVVLARTDETSRAKWDRGFREFLQLGNALLQQPDSLSMPRSREVFRENGTAYIVLDSPKLPEGERLRDYVKKNGPMGYADCVRALLPLAEDLARLHRAGSLHRRIGPYDMLVGKAAADRRGSLPFSFSLSCPQTLNDTAGPDDHAERISDPIVPIPFEPLERYSTNKPEGPWSDVYSLCAALYFCVTGREPPDAISRASDGGRAAPLPDLPPELSPGQRAVLEDGMAIQPEGRIRSMDDLVRRLMESLKDRGGFDPAQDVPPQPEDKIDTCPHCRFQWKTPAVLGTPKFCPHCGGKLNGGIKLWGL